MTAPRRPLSLCVITHDEERNLGRCLASAAFADDVVVLDSGSSDRTVELARAAGARVFVEPFRGFAGQRARAIELAKHGWVLILDADEELSPELRASIERALALPQDGIERGIGDGIAGYELARKTCYAGRFIEHSGWWPEWRLRLFDRERGRITGEDPHDRIDVDGRVERLAGALHHYPYRDLAHHVAKVNDYTTTMARGLLARGARARWLDLLVRPPARFLRMYVLRRGFLDGGRGFLLAAIGAFYVFLKYAKLWELARAAVEPAKPDVVESAGSRPVSSSG